MGDHSLEYVQTLRDAKTEIYTSQGLAQYWVPIDETQTNFFELGIARFTPGTSGYVHPPHPKYDSEWRFALVPVECPVTVKTRTGTDQDLNPFEFAYIPNSVHHEVRNTGDIDAWFVWAAIPTSTETDITDTVNIVRTFHDVESHVGTGEDDMKTYWVTLSEKTVGVSDFTMGLIFRPPGTEVPLHKHDPPDTREAFVTLEGEMGVASHDEEYYELSPFDALYVPPNGQHSNRNIGPSSLRYVFIETTPEPDLVFL